MNPQRRSTTRRSSRFTALLFAAAGWFALALPAVADDSSSRASTPSPDAAPLTEREKAVHALNRLAFGPRPGEVDRVLELGVENWMRRQLQPRTIDDRFAARFADSLYPSLSMTNGDILRAYRVPYTPYLLEDRPTAEESRRRAQEQREINRLRATAQRELRNAVLHRAIYSERQFEEVIVGFWREHFSVDQTKDDVSYFANNFEARVLRQHAFGRFGDMLLASARHPAMLVYLDNIVSQKPLSAREQRLVDRFRGKLNVPSSVLALQRHRGLNENYARELMELHTLGVDRQYTQQDVTELARVLTGWSAAWSDGARHPENRRGKEPFATYEFAFKPHFHDDEDKFIFGTRLRGGGEDQGVAVIQALAQHRYTADFISRKLCAYLLRDKPCESLVAEVAEVFTRTGGHLPSVYEAIVFSDDFFARENVRVKFKTPFEFVVSAIRATGAEVDRLGPMHNALGLMGQPIYRCPDPTGWSDSAEAWLDPGVLVYRWTFALDLAGGELSGVRVPDALFANLPAKRLRDKLVAQVMPAGLSPRTERIIDQTLGEDATAKELLAVLLGSPDFQQH